MKAFWKRFLLRCASRVLRIAARLMRWGGSPDVACADLLLYAAVVHPNPVTEFWLLTDALAIYDGAASKSVIEPLARARFAICLARVRDPQTDIQAMAAFRRAFESAGETWSERTQKDILGRARIERKLCARRVERHDDENGDREAVSCG